METKPICANCGKTIETDSIETADGEMICQECYENYYNTCAKCGGVFYSDDMRVAFDEVYCEDCFDEDFITCDDCGEVEKVENSRSINGDRYVCDNCSSNYVDCYDCGYTMHVDDAYYSENNEEWYCEDCYPNEEEEDGLFQYHSGGGRGCLSDEYRYRIGFEIEKEDGRVKDKIVDYGVQNLLTDTAWVVEHDASLDYEVGFEAISPIYKLKISDLKRKLTNGIIKDIVNARKSEHCGGHITISDTNRTGGELIDDLEGYFPILYAIYPGRAENGYCSKCDKDRAKSGGHTAVSIRNNYKGGGVEFRIFPAVSGYKNLLDRARLLKFMITHKAPRVQQALRYLRTNKKLRDIVLRLLADSMSGSDEDRINFFEDRLIHYSREVVKQRARTKIVSKLLKTKK